MNQAYANPTQVYEEISSKYRRGPLKLLSSKYFLACRVAITCAFSGDFSKEINDQELLASLSVVVKQLNNIDKNLVPNKGRSIHSQIAALRDLCINHGYLFSSLKSRNDIPTWRVTPDARRAFEATDTLAEDDNRNFTSARLTMIKNQIEQIEIDLTANEQERAARIQAQIDKLVQERDKAYAGTSTQTTKEEAKDKVEQLYLLMRDLPTDVETVAYRVQTQTTTLTDELDNKVKTLAEMLRDFNTKTFDILATSEEGRSYTDALRIMTTNEMDEITERLEALERHTLLKDSIPYGYLSRAWDDLLRAVDHVQANNREGSTIVVKTSQSALTHNNRRGAAYRAQALAALAENPDIAEKLEILVPWQYPRLAQEPNLVFQTNTDFTMADIGNATKQDISLIDHSRLITLAGPKTIARIKEIIDKTAGTPDDEPLFLSEILNTLPKQSRRLVEWAGLFDYLSSHGAALGDTTTWMLIDADDNEASWSGAEIIIRRSDLINCITPKRE